MVRCPSCGSESAGRFCPNCGESLQRLCPGCGGTVDPGHSFCASCGTPLSGQPPEDAQPPGASTIGDIGMVRGNLDASTHIGVQANIAGPVTVQVGAHQPSAEDLVAQGRRLLDARAYRDATAVLQDALSADPSSPHASLLLALTLLAGRNPDVVRSDVIQRAESHLLVAMESEDAHDVALVVLGVIKHDHYVANGMNEGQPTLHQIVQELQGARLSRRDRRLLAHLKASARVKRRLRVNW
jgi:hypothetical protein